MCDARGLLLGEVAKNCGHLATEVAHADEALTAVEADPQIKGVIASNQWHCGIAVWLAKGRFLEIAPNAPRRGETRYVATAITAIF